MKRIWYILTIVLISAPAIAQTTAGQLLRQGMYKEDIEGDLKGAIIVYERILSRFPDDRKSAAMSQLRIGCCQEKLGLNEAAASYRSVIANFSDQTQVVKAARVKLARLNGRGEGLSTEEKAALVDYYIKRKYVDLMSDLSADGSKIAFTDWTTGNLVVKDVKSGQITPLTHKTWDESREFAYWKVWSRDGKRIAYVWYGGIDSAQLRVISVDGGNPQIVHAHPGMYLQPKDWTPDGNYIIAKLTRLKEADPTEGPGQKVVRLSLSSGSYEILYAVDGMARGTECSRDGQHIVFGNKLGDEAVGGKVYLYSFTDRSVIQVPGLEASDSPCWSPDGRFVLYRVMTGQGANLVALEMDKGKAVGRPIVIGTNLAETVRRRAGVTNEHLNAYLRKSEALLLSAEKRAMESFDEEFTANVLDTAWDVLAWEGPNVYGFSSCGRYSLSARPGYLRYEPDPMTSLGGNPMFCDSYSYWYYPALVLCRMFKGTQWCLEAKGTIRLLSGADNQG
ncbi:MAG TPA: hypothetical protein DEP53_18055, partial [Bacteroidetes bacterium]|nr:hypothetical protein [Bacteroidota bacterium]